MELLAVTINFLFVPDKALVELTGEEKTTVPELAPAPVVAVVIFT